MTEPHDENVNDAIPEETEAGEPTPVDPEPDEEDEEEE